MWIGVGMAVARLLMFFGIVSLTAWSYSLWGSDHSPLGVLLTPAIGLIILSVTLRIALGILTRWIARLVLLERKRAGIHHQIRTSREMIQKI